MSLKISGALARKASIASGASFWMSSNPAISIMREVLNPRWQANLRNTGTNSGATHMFMGARLFLLLSRRKLRAPRRRERRTFFDVFSRVMSTLFKFLSIGAR